jgi:arylsulfatase A-like enzyme
MVIGSLTGAKDEGSVDSLKGAAAQADLTYMPRSRWQRGALAGAFAGLAFAVLETTGRYLPTVAGTDLSPDAALPILALAAYVVAGVLLGLAHPWLGMGAPLLLVAAAGEVEPTVVALALAAVGCVVAAYRLPRVAGAAAALALAGACLLPRAESVRTGTPERPDVVLVVLDTVGARATSLHGADLPTTPVLERLAREGVWFQSAVATAPWTVPSHASLLTGEHPRTLGCHHENPELPEGVPTTAEVLADAGYRTGAFLANPWVGRFNGLTRGFQHSESLWELQRKSQAFTWVRLVGLLGGEGEPAKGGSLLIRHTLDWLDRAGDTPSFVLVNLLEAHSPFHFVPEAERFGVEDPVGVGERTHQAQMLGPDVVDYPRPGEVEQARRLHAAGIRFVDSLVGDLVDGLAERGRLDRTLLVVTSDHGEAFGEHGFHGHMVGLHAETLHVPLVLRHPLLGAGRVIEDVVSLRAVHPTIVAFATGKATPGSLLAEPEAAVAVSEQRRPLQVLSDWTSEGERDPAGLSHIDGRALRVRRGDLVLLRETPAAGGEPSFSFYDLATDPTEAHDLWPDPRATELLPLLEAHDAKAVAGAGDTAPGSELPLDLRAQLEALGYLGG